MTVTDVRYRYEREMFFRKHNCDFEVQTSQMDEYGMYHKEYIFADGAIWYEVMSPEYVKEEVNIKLCKVTVEVKMFRTEFWSSDDSVSKFYYEKF